MLHHTIIWHHKFYNAKLSKHACNFALNICIERQIAQLPIDFGTVRFELREASVNVEPSPMKWFSSCTVRLLRAPWFLPWSRRRARKASRLERMKTWRALAPTGNSASYTRETIRYITRITGKEPRDSEDLIPEENLAVVIVTNHTYSPANATIIFTKDNSTNSPRNIFQHPILQDLLLPHKFSLSSTIYLAFRRVHRNILSIFQTTCSLDEFRITGRSAGLQMQKYVSRPRARLAQPLASATLKLHFAGPLARITFPIREEPSNQPNSQPWRW